MSSSSTSCGKVNAVSKRLEPRWRKRRTKTGHQKLFGSSRAKRCLRTRNSAPHGSSSRISRRSSRRTDSRSTSCDISGGLWRRQRRTRIRPSSKLSRFFVGIGSFPETGRFSACTGSMPTRFANRRGRKIPKSKKRLAGSWRNIWVWLRKNGSPLLKASMFWRLFPIQQLGLEQVVIMMVFLSQPDSWVSIKPILDSVAGLIFAEWIGLFCSVANHSLLSSAHGSDWMGGIGRVCSLDGRNSPCAVCGRS